jgi:hypothetical protein
MGGTSRGKVELLLLKRGIPRKTAMIFADQTQGELPSLQREQFPQALIREFFVVFRVNPRFKW